MRTRNRLGTPRAALRPAAAVVAAALGLAAFGLSACASGGPKFATSGSELSFAQVQAIQPGLTVAQVRDAYGEPKRVSVRPSGRTERLEYAALDAKGGRNTLFLDFDEREVLRQKTFSGAILRP